MKKFPDAIPSDLMPLTLNPRVSVFRHKGGIYLFDPATRTYAAMNETLLALVTKPDDVHSAEEVCGDDRTELTEAVMQFRRLGILKRPEEIVQGDRRPAPESFGSMTRLHIFVTTRCNLRCVYCYAKGGDSERIISRDIWQTAMDHFFSNLTFDAAQKTPKPIEVNLTVHGGGEPTIEFDTLKDIVSEFRRRAAEMGLKPSVAMGTNGTYGDSVHQWIVENNINVNISLDGPQHVQNRQRPFCSGEPSYDTVVRNLQLLVKSGRRVSVRATITSESIETMEETVKLAEQLGLAAVHFEPVTLTGRGSTVSRPDPDQFVEKFLECFLLGLELDIDVKYSGMHCFKDCHQRFCSACGRNFCVTTEGNITTCYEVLDANDPAADIFFVGKIEPLQASVEWDLARIKELEQRIADNMEACEDCLLRYQCAGDCPIKSFRHSNRDLYSPDPFRCHIAKQINMSLIALLADGVIEPRDVGQARVVDFN
ncbi:MAG TPA: radical SAM protein [Geobacteraceae bacterium]